MKSEAKKFAIRLMKYGPEQQLAECTVARVEEISDHVGKAEVLWVDIEGAIDSEALNKIGNLFKLHALALEDVLHSHQRSKVERYSGHHFVVTRMVSLAKKLTSEQLSIFFGKGFVVTFQDKLGGDCLEPVRKRIREAMGTIRKESAEYLAYALIDAVVDGYFPVLDELGERINALEDEILVRYDTRFPSRIHALKRDVWNLRRTIWPLRDAINTLVRDFGASVAHETQLYMRDCYDHCVRIIDMVDTHHEHCASLMELYLGRESSRMNEILKVLAILSTIFMPPTLVAGIYGMNFNVDKSPLNMPELGWYYGYPFALVLMGAMMLGLLVWLWFKGWLSQPKRFRKPDANE